MMAANWDTIEEKTAQMFGGQIGATGTSQAAQNQGRLDVPAYLNRYGISHKIKTNGSATYYQLDHCLFDSAHVKDAAIIQDVSGKLAYHCFHDGCRGKTWKDARTVISGEEKLREFVTGGMDTGTGRAPASDQKGPKPDIELKTLGEIHREEIEFPPPLIEGLLEQGDSLLLTGPTGLGKSLTVNAISLAVASGKPLFDKLKIHAPQNVVIFQSENSQKATKIRTSALVASFKGRVDAEVYLKALDRIFIATRSGDPRVAGDLLDPVYASDLADSVKATHAGLVILDPLISYHRNDENDNTRMRNVLDHLTRVVGPQTSVLITHHHGKGDHDGMNQSRGATAILDWARGILTLNRQPHASKNLIRVEHTKAGNFARSPSFLLEVDGPCVIPIELDVLVPPSKVGEVLRDMGGLAESKNTLAQTIMETCEVSRRTAQEAIDRAFDFGMIRVDRQGQKNIYRSV